MITVRRLVSLIAVALVVASPAACGHFGGGDAEKLDDALIRPVEKGDLLDEVSESGKITPAFEVDIKSKVSGEVTEVRVDEGQAVHTGDLLLTVDRTEYEREVAQARVSLKEARMRLVNAQTEEKRNAQALAARGIAEIEYTQAKQQAQLATVEVERAKLNLQQSEEQLSWTQVTSPIDGMVIVRNIEPGEVVTAGVTATVNGEPQLTIAEMDRLLLELDLNQVDVAKVALGQSAKILLDAYPGHDVVGTVTQIAAAAHTDATRGIDVFKVKVEIDPSKSDVAIKPGMTAEVRIQIGDYPGVVKVPVETIFQEEGKSYVYVVKDDAGTPKKEKTEVQVGHRSDREAEITSGLAEGDKIYAQAEVKDLGAKFD
jgi:RND family efflux transporter MFP subunit